VFYHAARRLGYGVGIADTGLILACMGCCCGHPERGGPKTLPGTLKRQLRRAFREARPEGLRLAFSDCLGPCSEANVVFLYLHGRPYWLRRINTVEDFAVLLDWASKAAADGSTALPAGLQGRAFAWTGGGPGPMPPVEP
jgi:cobaltochelatase CobN